MTTICLIRHGETDWNIEKKLQGVEDIELNDTGRMQARNCVSLFCNNEWDVIITSPLKRARETAEIIATEIGLKDIVVMQEFIERDFGLASGLTYEERKQRFPDGNIEGEESREALKERIMKTLTELTKQYYGKRVLVVSHGAVINCVLAILSNGEIGTGKTVLKNACINMLQHDDNNWKIEVANVAVEDN